MADIAELGLKANTGDLVEAKARLDALVPAAQRAETASSKLENALNGTGTAAQKAAAGLNAAAAPATRMAEGYDILTGKMNKSFLAINSNIAKITSTPIDNVGKSLKFTALEGLNFSRQMADIGVTAFSGMNPFMIALQQGPQLFDILQNKAVTTGATIGTVFRAAGATIWTALAPLLPLIAAVALAVSAISIAFSLATRQINKGSGDIAKGLDLTEKQMERLKKTGVETGVTISDTFTAFFQVIGERLVSAFDGPLKWLRKAWNTTMDFITEYGSLAIKYWIGAWVGGVYAVRDSWKLLPRAIGDAAYSAANVVIASVEFLINKSIAGLNYLLGFANAAAEKVGLSGLGTVNSVSIGRVANPFAGGMSDIASSVSGGISRGIKDASGAVDRFFGDVGKRARKNARDRILEAAGPGAPDKAGRKGREEKDKSAEYIDNARDALKTLTAFMALGGPIEKLGADVIQAGADRIKAFDEIVQSANDGISSLSQEAQMIGLTDQQADKLRITYDLLNQAKQKNIELTPGEISQIESLAERQAQLAANVTRTREAFDFARDGTRGFIGDLIGGLRQGQNAFAAFTGAVTNMLNKVLDKMLDLATNDLFSGGNSSGGFLNSVFGAVKGLFGDGMNGGGSVGIPKAAIPNAKGNAFMNGIVDNPTAFRFGKGGANLGIMGEAGPEAVVPLQRGPDGSLGVQSFGGAGRGSAPAAVQISVAVEEGALFRPVVREIAQGESSSAMQAGIREYDSELPSRFNQIAQDSRVRG